MEQGLKVVLHFGVERAVIGVQEKDTDPAMETISVASLDAALVAVPGLVARAREKWAASPKNPAYQGPPVAPAPATVAQQRGPSSPPARQAGAERPRMF